MEENDKTNKCAYIPHYEYGADSVRTRRVHPHSRVLTRRYNPSWTPVNTLADGEKCHTTGSAKRGKRGDLEAVTSQNGSTRTPTEDTVRASKRQKIGAHPDIGGSATALVVGRTNPSELLPPRRPSACRLGKDLFSQNTPAFVNSEYHSVDKMMRTKSNQPRLSESTKKRGLIATTPGPDFAKIRPKNCDQNSRPEPLISIFNEFGKIEDSIPSLINLSSREMPSREVCGSHPDIKNHRLVSSPTVHRESQKEHYDSMKDTPKSHYHGTITEEAEESRSESNRLNTPSWSEKADDQEQSREPGVLETSHHLRDCFFRDEEEIEQDDNDELHASMTLARKPSNTGVCVTRKPPRSRQKLVNMLRKDANSTEAQLSNSQYHRPSVVNNLSNSRRSSCSEHALPNSQFREHPNVLTSFSTYIQPTEETKLLEKRTASKPIEIGEQTHSSNSHSQGRPSLGNDELQKPVPQNLNTRKATPNSTRNEGLDNAASRAVRSSSRLQTNAQDVCATVANPRQHVTKCTDTGTRPWKGPLLFPPEDPGKAVVQFGDLRRLDEGEFLNDSLLTFGLKHYEHRYRRATKSPKKTYIFNTFFFEKLCATKAAKANINYDGVKRWTSKIDIFDFDYIIVPINESAHWYGALICNLPNILDNVSESLDSQQTFHDETLTQSPPSVSQPGYGNGEIPEGLTKADDLENTTRGGSTHLIKSGPQSCLVDQPKQSQATSKNKSRSETAIKAAASHQATSKQAARKHAHDPERPVIIMLDSFGENHPATARKLNQYLREESRAKLKLELDALPCINAKGIPLQPNAFDCGVYFLGYLQTFFNEPYEFVAKAVTRSFNVNTDFSNLDAPLIRQSLRTVIQDRYEKQRSAMQNKSTK